MTINEQILSDLDAIFTDGLTIDITHTYNGGESSETLKAFFDRSYGVALQEGVGIESASLSILIRTSEVGNIDRDSEFTIQDTTYYVIENQGDDQGVTRILISEDKV